MAMEGEKRSSAEELPLQSQQNTEPNVSIHDAEQQREATPAAPPDGGKVAWIQVLASFLINFNVYGLVNAFGEFQHFYETEYLVSYSSSTISWIGTVQGALILFVGALSGPIFDKGYFLITLQSSTIALVVSWMLLSVSGKYYQVGDKLSHGSQGHILIYIRSCSPKEFSLACVLVSWKYQALP